MISWLSSLFAMPGIDELCEMVTLGVAIAEGIHDVRDARRKRRLSRVDEDVIPDEEYDNQFEGVDTTRRIVDTTTTATRGRDGLGIHPAAPPGRGPAGSIVDVEQEAVADAEAKVGIATASASATSKLPEDEGPSTTLGGTIAIAPLTEKVKVPDPACSSDAGETRPEKADINGERPPAAAAAPVAIVHKQDKEAAKDAVAVAEVETSAASETTELLPAPPPVPVEAPAPGTETAPGVEVVEYPEAEEEDDSGLVRGSSAEGASSSDSESDRLEVENAENAPPQGQEQVAVEVATPRDERKSTPADHEVENDHDDEEQATFADRVSSALIIQKEQDDEPEPDEDVDEEAGAAAFHLEKQELKQQELLRLQRLKHRGNVAARYVASVTAKTKEEVQKTPHRLTQGKEFVKLELESQTPRNSRNSGTPGSSQISN